MAPGRYSIFSGSGSYLPTRIVENGSFADNKFFLDYGRPIEPTENGAVLEKFRDITEISQRRHVTDDLVASDIGTEAARAAIADGGVDPETLDYIVVAHNFGDVSSADHQMDFCPTLAARIKERLGISNPWCIAYDLPFGCPGWLQAVIQADYFLRSGDASRALVIGAETLSRVSDPHDRDSMLYADGAGAVVLDAVESDTPIGILGHATRSDALEYSRLLRMGPAYDPDYEPNRLFLKMEGRQLYRYAVQTAPAVLKECLDRAGLTLSDVTKLLIHQANTKMDDAILARLFELYGLTDIPDDIMPMTVSWLGNSSVATLPTLLDLIRHDKIDHHRIGAGDLLIFASMGAGMNINSMAYRCP